MKRLCDQAMPRGVDPPEVALLLHDSGVFFAHYSPQSRHEPHSAVSELIQGIWNADPSMARMILRNRVYFSGAPSELDYGMLNVAAKRMTASFPDPLSFVMPGSVDAPLTETPVRVSFAGSSHSAGDLEEFARTRIDQGVHPLYVTMELLERIPRRAPRPESDRSVAALAVDATGKLLAAAVNTNGRNRTLHAELSLAQNYWQLHRRALPIGTTVFTTLKSCKMCAAALWQLSEDPAQLTVVYGLDDPGPCAEHTVFQPGTHERNRASRDRPELVKIEIETGPEFESDNAHDAPQDR